MKLVIMSLFLMISCGQDSTKEPSSINKAHIKLPGPTCMGGRIQILIGENTYEIGNKTPESVSTLLSNYNSSPPPNAISSLPCQNLYEIEFKGEIAEDYIWLYATKNLTEVIHLQNITIL